MDLLAYFYSSIALVLVFILCFYYIVLRRNNVPNVKILPPEAAGAWPIIGHLPQLAKPELPHVILGAMADKYGSIYSIRLGIRQAVVVSSWQIAKELFTTKDMAVASRPKSIATKIMGYNHAMFAFAPYGPYWREVRKMTTLKLLSNRQIDLLKHVQVTEVEAWLKELHKFWKGRNDGSSRVLVDMKKWFKDLTMNVILRVIAGKRSFGAGAEGDEEEVKRCQKATIEVMRFDADVVNKSTCLTMILGGAETTATTLTWILSLLLNHRDALRKVQEELEINVEKGRLVQESDIRNLVYLQAVVKETMRLYPPAPLSAPREVIKDCSIGGYHVQKGTRLIMNLWKIQTDPSVWAEPLKFWPKRFLETHTHVEGQDHQLIPFGGGRRGCPGESFAMQVIPLALASVLHAFDFSTPSDALVDMTGSVGITNMKATPLEVLVSPRLSPQIFGSC
ncbi:hypothetical protein SLE2022_215060 [Rubroshorea leprosula]